MRTKIRAHWARIRVLFTVLVAIAILSTLIYLLSGGGLFRAKASIFTYFEDSGGMDTEAVVMYNGVKIGKVSSVELSHLSDPQRAVKVRMSIGYEFLRQIPEDSKSEIVIENFLGDKFVQINRGQSPVPVKDMAELGHKPATNVYIRIDLTTFAAQLRLIDKTLSDIQEGKGPIGEFVMKDDLYRDLLSGVKQIEKQISALADTKSQTGSLLYGRELYDNISGTFQRLDKTLAQLEAGRGPAGKLLRDPAQYEDLRKQTADVRRQIAQIRDSDFIKSDAAYESWNRGLASVSRSVDAFNTNAMLTSNQVYESLLGSTQELGNNLKDFRSNPKKFLHLKIF